MGKMTNGIQIKITREQSIKIQKETYERFP